MQLRFTSVYLSLLLACSFFYSSSLSAQDKDEEEQTLELYNLSLKELLDVKVTVASAFSESLLQASSSVFVTTREQWQRQGDQQITDVLSHLPSVVSYSTLGSNTVAIRGFSHSTSVRGIATVLDGVPMNNYAFGTSFYDKINFDLNALDKIEVIRGPSSAIYGSDSFHGVVALQGYQGEKDEATLRAQLGENGLYASSLRVSQAVGDNHRIHLMLGSNAQPDIGLDYYYTEPATGIEKSSEYAYQQQQQSALLRFQSIDKSLFYYDMGLYLNSYKADHHPGIGTQFFAGVSELEDRDWVDADTDFNMFRVSMGKQLSNDISVDFLSYYMDSKVDHVSDLVRFNGSRQITQDAENKAGLKVDIKQAENAWNTEWVVSLSYDKTNITDKSTLLVDVNNSVLSNTLDQADGKVRDSRALMAQAKTRLFADKLVLLYGGRVDDLSDVGHQFTPRAGIIYLPNNRSAVKFLYGRAFRAPTALEQTGIGVAQGDENLESEIIDTLEWVFMLEGQGWRSELLVFYSQWSNAIVLGDCVLSDGCDPALYSGRYTNIDDNTSKGIELIFEGEWNDWFSRDSLSYVESVNETSGVEYSAFPRWVINLDGGMKFDELGSEFYITNKIYLDLSEGPELASTSTSSKKLQPYWRTDFHISKAFSLQSQIYFDVNNIFNRNDYKPALWNNENGLEGKPRTFIVGLQHSF